MALRLLSTKAISAIAKPQYFCRGLTTFGSLRTTCFRSNKTIPIRNFSKTPFLKNDSVLKTKTDPFTPHGDEASGVRNDFAYLFGGVSLVGGGCTYLYASRSKSNLDSEGAYTTDDFTQKVQKTYAYILGGIGITATSAFCFFKTKLPYKFLSMNPWAFLGTSLVIGIPTLIAAISIDYHENPVAKHIAWASFNVAEGACLCTLGFFGAPVIAQAALATVALVGGLSFVGMSINRKNPDNLAKYETPLGVGLGVIVLLDWVQCFTQFLFSKVLCFMVDWPSSVG